MSCLKYVRLKNVAVPVEALDLLHFGLKNFSWPMQFRFHLGKVLPSDTVLYLIEPKYVASNTVYVFTWSSRWRGRLSLSLLFILSFSCILLFLFLTLSQSQFPLSKTFVVSGRKKNNLFRGSPIKFDTLRLVDDSWAEFLSFKVGFFVDGDSLSVANYYLRWRSAVAKLAERPSKGPGSLCNSADMSLNPGRSIRW